MKFGVPWSSKRIRPDARETAKEAARRAGMSLDDWLNSVIFQQATQMGMQAHPQAQGGSGESQRELAAVQQRLDHLTQRIEQVTGTGPVAYAPQQYRDASDQRAALAGRRDQFASAGRPLAPPLAPSAMPMPASLDRAVAEITARQRTLNGAPAARQQQPAPTTPASAPLPAQNLSGLEDQLRRITDQIETLRRPGVEEAINALRGELAEIGHAINDAMPRQAIDTIERQIQGLNQRIVEGRQNGVDTGALAGIERGLAEVRDALRHLTPAENLVGFNEAVAGLAQKIDLIVGEKDPATLQQLEHAITTLRGMVAHVASNETVGALAAEVQGLADKIDHIATSGAAGDVLSHLEQRIDALSHALTERAQSGNTVPPQLEALVQSLTDKIEQIQHTRGNDNVVVSHLEDRIVKLVEKLDASDSRLGHLEAIERGLADLLVHIEDMRATKDAEAAHAGNVTVDVLKHDIARTNDALDAVHGTLGHVVDRLAMIEEDMRGGRATWPAAEPNPDPLPLELTQPVGKVAARLVPDAPAAAAPELAPQPQPPAQHQEWPQPQAAEPAAPPQTDAQPAPPPHAEPPRQAAPDTAKPAAPKRLPPVAQLPINPDLPPDEPLEPGSGPPQMRANPGARIAASEAALGGAGASAMAPGSTSNFIAAARRAAQAAVQAESTSTRPERASEDYNDAGSLRAKMMKRVKSLFVAASIIAVVVGSAQIAGNMFLGGDHAPNTTSAQRAGADSTMQVATTPKTAAPDVPEQARAEPANGPTAKSAGQVASGYNLLAPLPTNPLTSLPPAPTTLSNPATPSPAAATTVSALPSPDPRDGASRADITGSIPRTASKQPAAARKQDQLPTEIGGPQLRNAALAGDPAAAYQVGLRFAEGRGVPVNLPEAARWYERAASKGMAPAQFRYASMLEKGRGVKKDVGQARRLYLAAAGQGNAKAMHNLAVLYAEGADGRPDYGTAAKWFSKAAEHGVADSQYNLGILYARGIGVGKSLADSYKWFALAAAHGDREAAKKRDEVASNMDAPALATARHAVETFKPAQQPEQATAVAEPPGGWDRASSKATPKAKPQPGPLSLGAFTIGKR